MSHDQILDPLRERAAGAALLFDVDGTLAPIVDDPQAAAVPVETVAELARLADAYRLVACISGRRAVEARRIVGLDELAYAGNHGLELLLPDRGAPRLHPRLEESTAAARTFVSALDRDELAAAGLRLEDKGPIQALHWRGASDEEGAAQRADQIAGLAEDAGLRTHHGRLVLELRPDADVNKGDAVRELIATASAVAGLYAGDDRTDLDAFAALRELAAAGELDPAVCVGIASDEGPDEIQREADVVVGSPAEFLDLLRAL